MKARRQRLWKMFLGLHIGCNWNEEACWLFELDSCFWPTNQCKSSFHHAWQYLAIMVTWEAVHLKSGCSGKRTQTRTKKERKTEIFFLKMEFLPFLTLAFGLYILPNAAFPSPFKQRIKSWPDHNSKEGWLYKFASHCRKCEQTGANNFVT